MGHSLLCQLNTDYMNNLIMDNTNFYGLFQCITYLNVLALHINKCPDADNNCSNQSVMPFN